MRDRLVRAFALPVKVAILVLVAFRFHGTWVGLVVVAALAFLLFGVDRTVRTWAARAIGGMK